MSIGYKVYHRWSPPGRALTGPLSLIATTPSLTADTGSLAPGTHEFLVTAYDTGTGLESQNGDGRLVVVVADDGSDATGRPGVPAGLSVRAAAGGTARATVLPPASGGAPSLYRLYLWPASGSRPTTPTAVAAADPYRPRSVDLAGLSDGVRYLVAAGAVNAAGQGPLTAPVAVVGNAAGPPAVASLTATVVP